MIEMDYTSTIKEVTTNNDIFTFDMKSTNRGENQAVLEIISKPINYMMVTGNDIIGLAG